MPDPAASPDGKPLGRGITLLEGALILALLAGVAWLARSRAREANEARIRKNEASAISALKAVVAAGRAYVRTDYGVVGFDHERGVTIVDYGSPQTYRLPLLGALRLIDPAVANGRKEGYSFTVEATAAGPEESYRAAAVPLEPGESGRRCFYVDPSGVVRFNPRGPASSADSPIE